MSAATASTYLHYTLTLRSPAIASTLSGDPNSAATQPFIPGGAIRGAVAGRLLARGTADGEEFRQLVLSGAVRYLHAYPEVAGARGLPASLAWRSEKLEADRARDLAAFSGGIDEADDAEDFAEVWPPEGLGPLGASFAATASSAGRRPVVTPRVQARLHQQRDRVKGRPWVDTRDGRETRHGTIFAYEYLEADQVFRGAVQVTARAAVELARVKRLFSQPILIGRSRRAGYGGEAQLEFTADSHREYQSVSGSLRRDLGAGERCRLLLTSAYVGRHPATGQIDPAALMREVGERLGGGVEIERHRWGFEIVGSFNRKWRLEVPQVQAVAAGAVLVLKTSRSIPQALLREVEDQGLGERRVEGFGRLLFLEHSDDGEAFRLERRVERPTLRQRAEPPAETPESVTGQLELLERRIVLAAAKAELDRLAADLARRAVRVPTNSLLGRLRTLFRGVGDEATASAALADLGVWCGEDETRALRPNARDKLKACRLGQGHLLAWLAALARDDGGRGRWQQLVAAVAGASSLTGLAHKHHLTAPASAQAVLEHHAALLGVHLVDALLAALARRNRGGA